MLSKLKDCFYFWFGKDDRWEETKRVINMTGISEPVTSFVECVRNNPRRFDCKRNYGSRVVVNGVHMGYKIAYWVKDKTTGEAWYYGMLLVKGSGASSVEWLTNEERRYLIDELSQIYTARSRKLSTIKEVRKQRACNAERKRLIGIYCKGE